MVNKMKTNFYCGNQDDPHVNGAKSECYAMGEIEFNDFVWINKEAHMTCPKCGVELYQGWGHFGER